jgi:hypothetical protein
VLLYNTMHLIDANQLEFLDLLAHNTQLFSLQTATPSSNTHTPTSTSTFTLHDVFQLPPLLWAVQAFTVDMQEESCTSWLHRLLKGM